ncbi:ABC transporter ATP-binding protein [Paenibacillus taichungensis]|uniref:ABC transporter ATP-binding protein n=1 Tax=Paenibacillus taichungensis TaxID=484184 RepID=UPI0038CFD4D4
MKRYFKDARSLISVVKGGFFFALVILFIETCSNLSLIYLQKNLIDNVFIAGHLEAFPMAIGLYAAVAIIYSVFFSLSNYAQVRTVQGINNALMRKLFGRLHKYPVSAIQNERIGKYIQIMTNNAAQVGTLLGWQVPRFIQEAMNLIILAVILSVISPVLLIVVLVFSIIHFFVGKYFFAKIKHISTEVQNGKAEMVVFLEEGVSSTKEVVAFHRMGWEKKIYDRIFNKYFNNVMAEGKAINKHLFLTDPFKWLVTFGVLGFGGWSMLNGNMTIGTFIIVYQYSMMLTESIHSFSNYAIFLSGQMVHIDNVKSVLEGPQIKDGDIRLIKGEIDSLTIDELSFQYPSQHTPVLNNFSAQLPIGKKIAFVGTSGSGKSTLAQLLVRFFEPSKGAILINGNHLEQIKRDDWADNVALVAQDPYLFSESISLNISLNRNFTEADIIEACKTAQIHDYILNLRDGYSTNVGERGVKLSGGQRQRISIARAIVGNPEILIMDEATSALDLETERQIMTRIDELRKGKTTIVIAHRLSTIENADIIFVLKDGQLAECGRHEELMLNRQVYYQLVATNQKEHMMIHS